MVVGRGGRDRLASAGQHGWTTNLVLGARRGISHARGLPRVQVQPRRARGGGPPSLARHSRPLRGPAHRNLRDPGRGRRHSALAGLAAGRTGRALVFRGRRLLQRGPHQSAPGRRQAGGLHPRGSVRASLRRRLGVDRARSRRAAAAVRILEPGGNRPLGHPLLSGAARPLVRRLPRPDPEDLRRSFGPRGARRGELQRRRAPALRRRPWASSRPRVFQASPTRSWRCRR
jgi:hypothetical protein